MVSLQEQLLKAGLVDKKKIKRASHDKSNEKKAERRTGTQTVDELRLAALETQQKNAERTRQLNAERVAAANQKAIMAQIVQMVQTRSEEHTSELQSLMRLSYAVFCLKKKTINKTRETMKH